MHLQNDEHPEIFLRILNTVSTICLTFPMFSEPVAIKCAHQLTDHGCCTKTPHEEHSFIK